MITHSSTRARRRYSRPSAAWFTRNPTCPGDYELKAGNGKIELEISPDKTFSETIFWPKGKIESRSRKWLHRILRASLPEGVTEFWSESS